MSALGKSAANGESPTGRLTIKECNSNSNSSVVLYVKEYSNSNSNDERVACHATDLLQPSLICTYWLLVHIISIIIITIIIIINHYAAAVLLTSTSMSTSLSILVPQGAR